MINYRKYRDQAIMAGISLVGLGKGVEVRVYHKDGAQRLEIRYIADDTIALGLKKYGWRKEDGNEDVWFFE